MTLTATHLANLTTLADWLEKHRLSGHMLDTGIFTMDTYFDEGLIDVDDYYHQIPTDQRALARDDCNTAACVVGWATVAIEPIGMEGWSMYARRLFGTNLDDILGRFLFSAGWAWFPESATIDAAIERIRVVVVGRGVIPPAWPNWNGSRVCDHDFEVA